MIEEWKSALDNGNMVGSIAIDLSRAFDSLDSLSHGLLLAKIYAYGFRLNHANQLRAIFIIAITQSKYMINKVIGYK